MPLDAQQKYERLVESLQALAMPFRRQLGLFPGFVHVPDELALAFDDGLRLFEQTLEFTQLTATQRRSLVDLDEHLNRLSGSHNAPYWTMDALERDPEWESIRRQATQALRDLGRQVQEPTLDWLTFVETSENEVDESDSADEDDANGSSPSPTGG